MKRALILLPIVWMFTIGFSFISSDVLAGGMRAFPEEFPSSEHMYWGP